MKLIIINRRKLGIIIMLVGLMLIIVGIGNNLSGKLKYTVLIQNDINSLKNYKTTDSSMQYKLPSAWTTKQQYFGGNEIIYHNDFKSDDAKIHGFVEVWNLKEDLKEFIDRSKKVAEENSTFKYYNIKPVTIKNHEGYELNYDMQTPGNIYYEGYEYFIKNDDKLYRIAFYVSEENFKDSMPSLFKVIAETMQF